MIGWGPGRDDRHARSLRRWRRRLRRHPLVLLGALLAAIVLGAVSATVLHFAPGAYLSAAALLVLTFERLTDGWL